MDLGRTLQPRYPELTRRDLLKNAAMAAAALAFPAPLARWRMGDPDHERLTDWTAVLHAEGLSRSDVPVGRGAVRVGELALGTPYQPFALEAYLRRGRR